MGSTLPNIVLIVLDTMGAKHMSLYGYPRLTTPNLERLAEEFKVFTRCYATSCWTIPSHASMFTGLYPSQHGAHEANLSLDVRCRHLATVLKQMGYRNYGFSANCLVSPQNGLCPDFDEFNEFDYDPHFMRFEQPENKARQEFLTQLILKPVSWEKFLFFLRYLLDSKDYEVPYQYVKRWLGRFFRLTPLQRSWPSSLKIMQKCFEIILQHQKSFPTPYFIFINIIEPHQHYNPPRLFRKYSSLYSWQKISTLKFHSPVYADKAKELLPEYVNLYDDEIITTDSLLATLLKNLKSLNSFDNTMVILTSDHGEHFGEKGHYEHRLSLYNELLWVPLMVKFPGSAHRGIDNRLASLNDLFATIMEVCQCAVPVPPSSVSLVGANKRSETLSMIVGGEYLWKDLPELRNENLPSSKFAVILDEGWKLIQREDDVLEVYNLALSQEEAKDLAPSLPADILRHFEELINSYIKEIDYQVQRYSDKGPAQSYKNVMWLNKL